MQTPLIILAVLAVVIVATYFVVRSRRIKSEAERPMTPPAAPIPGPAIQGDSPSWLAGANAPTPQPTWSSARTPESASAGSPAWNAGPEAASWDTQSFPLPQSAGGEPASSETVILPGGGSEPQPAGGAEWDQPAQPSQPEEPSLPQQPAPEQGFTPASGGATPAWDQPASSSSSELPAAPPEPAAVSGWDDAAPEPNPEPSSTHTQEPSAGSTWSSPPAAQQEPGPAVEPAAQGWGGGAPEAQGWAGAEPGWSGGEPAQTPAPEPSVEHAAEPSGEKAASPWDTQGAAEQWQPPPAPPAPAPAPSSSHELPPAPTWSEMETQSLTPPAEPAGDQAPPAPTWGDIESGGHFEPSQPGAGAVPEAPAAAAPVSDVFAPTRDIHVPPAEPGAPVPPAQAGPAEAPEAPPAGSEFGNIGETMILSPMQSPAAAAPQAEIMIETGPDRGHMYRLTGQGLSLGRSPDNDLILRDPATSGHHARFERRGTQFYVVDMGSTNGTLVNGEPIQERELKHGDRVTVGQNQVKFSVV